MYILQLICILSTLLSINSSQASEYSQTWLRGEGPEAHPHEGVQLSDRSGWVAIGDTLHEEFLNHRTQVMVRAVDNEAETIWTSFIGEDHRNYYSAGYSVIEVLNCRITCVFEQSGYVRSRLWLVGGWLCLL